MLIQIIEILVKGNANYGEPREVVDHVQANNIVFDLEERLYKGRSFNWKEVKDDIKIDSMPEFKKDIRKLREEMKEFEAGFKDFELRFNKFKEDVDKFSASL